MLNRDIENRNDIMILVNTFYNHVKKDRLIGPVFKEIAQVNWDTHLVKMYDFWDNIIFNTGSYRGNTLRVHENLNSLSALTEDHFEHWLQLFEVTVNELFTGKNAQKAINSANSIATVMKIKLHHN